MLTTLKHRLYSQILHRFTMGRTDNMLVVMLLTSWLATVHGQGRCSWGNATVGSIVGRNIAMHQGKSLQECKSACDSNPGCASIDYNAASKMCYLGSCRIGKQCSNSNDKTSVYYSCGKDPLWLPLEAINAQASQINTAHGGNADRAIDGNAASSWHSRSCTHTHNTHNPWWQVDLKGKYDITGIKLTNRGDCCGRNLNGFKVLVDGKECAKDVKIGQGQTVDVPCVANGQVLKVQVPRRTNIMIAEVKVGVNPETTTITTTPGPEWLILKGKKTSASSNGWGGVASRAVDGQKGTSWHSRSCVHTRRDNKPWWQVDLGANTNISTVKVTNRGDCCGNRMDGAKIYVDGKECANLGNVGKAKQVPCAAFGRVVKMQSQKRDYMNFCEFQVGIPKDPVKELAKLQATTTTTTRLAPTLSQPSTTSSCSPGVCEQGKFQFFFGDLTEAECKASCDAGRKMGVEGGLREEVYNFRQNGQFHDLKGKNKVLTRNVDNINYANSGGFFPGTRLRDHFYVHWSGFVIIKTPGTYTFYTASDDGSRMIIDGEQVVGNPGWHGRREKNGNALLEAGRHAFIAEFFEGGGGMCMQAYYKGPDTGNSKVLIPKSALAAPSGSSSSGGLTISEPAWKDGICKAYSHQAGSCILYSQCTSISETTEKVCGDPSIDFFGGSYTGFKTCVYTTAGSNSTGGSSNSGNFF